MYFKFIFKNAYGISVSTKLRLCLFLGKFSSLIDCVSIASQVRNSFLYNVNIDGMHV